MVSSGIIVKLEFIYLLNRVMFFVFFKVLKIKWKWCMLNIFNGYLIIFYILYIFSWFVFKFDIIY